MGHDSVQRHATEVRRCGVVDVVSLLAEAVCGLAKSLEIIGASSNATGEITLHVVSHSILCAPNVSISAANRFS